MLKEYFCNSRQIFSGMVNIGDCYETRMISSGATGSSGIATGAAGGGGCKNYQEEEEEMVSKSIVLCDGCSLKIEDRFYLLAVDKRWHLACLRCYQCNQPLQTQLTCYSRLGNIYCKQDYLRLFPAKRCSRCHQGISSKELVMRARDDVYHVNCFRCACCGVKLSKGDHFGIRDGFVYCRPHYDMMRLKDYFGPVELDELRPSSTPPRTPTGAATSIYNSHWNTFPNSGSIFPDSTTHKGRPRKLKPSIDNNEGLPLTKIQNSLISGSGTTGAGMHGVYHHGLLCVDMLQSNDLSSSIESTSPYDRRNCSASNSAGAGNSNSSSPNILIQQQLHSARTKRMRTSFKHHQLRAMKSYFNINQNPDAKDLKQLAQKTGLSKRVLQVWFQNARAKWRRGVVRQDIGGNPTGSGPPSSLQQSAAQNPTDLTVRQSDIQNISCNPGTGLMSTIADFHQRHQQLLHPVVQTSSQFDRLY